MAVCVHSEAFAGDGYLFEHHELIQEVNTLAGEEFPDGLLSLVKLRVRGGAHLGGLVAQELRQAEVLHGEKTKKKKKSSDEKKKISRRIIYLTERVCLNRNCTFCHCAVPTPHPDALGVSVCLHTRDGLT